MARSPATRPETPRDAESPRRRSYIFLNSFPFIFYPAATLIAVALAIILPLLRGPAAR
ncbi:MAG TPA: hypothetical protein VNC50_08235 [Planctomycetia bacterium]|nr:hypothetical protein [Planctomycetia bacterium]